MPSDIMGEEAFSVIRAAMGASGTEGIARLALYRRERVVLLQPYGKGIVLWTLSYGDEARDAGSYFDPPRNEKFDDGVLPLVAKLIKDRSAPWSSDMLADPVQEKLLDIIAAKKKGRKHLAKAKDQTAKPSGTIVNIMDALWKSITAQGTLKKQ